MSSPSPSPWVDAFIEALQQTSHRDSLEPRLRAPRINANLRVPERVLLPLRVRALHGEKVELLSFQHEPDRNRDCLPGLPTNHADLDLAVAGEAVSESFL